MEIDQSIKNAFSEAQDRAVINQKYHDASNELCDVLTKHFGNDNFKWSQFLVEFVMCIIIRASPNVKMAEGILKNMCGYMMIETLKEVKRRTNNDIH